MRNAPAYPRGGFVRRGALAGVAALALLMMLPGCMDKKQASEREVDTAIKLIANKKVDEASAHLDRAVGLNPENPKAYCAKGSVMRLKGKNDEAIELYNKAIKLNPDYTVCFDNLGIAYRDMGEMSKAEGAFLKAIETDPGYADAHFNLGYLYDQGMGDGARAAAEYKKYLKTGSNADLKKQLEGRIKELEAQK